MRELLKKYFRKATVKLPFLDAEFGPELTVSAQSPDIERQEPPRPAKTIAVTATSSSDPMLDAAALNEPDPEPHELIHPVSLLGSAFESALRANPEVDARLRHSRDRHVAHRAVNFVIIGVAPEDEKDKETRTWNQIRAACLKLIIEKLDEKHQRATYGAVAGIVGLLARSVMSGKPRIHKNSWVVAKANHLPTGYSDAEMHPALLERTLVLVTPNYLREWLRSPI